MYMAIHQHDMDANDLWLYFQSVIDWAKRYFPVKRKKIKEECMKSSSTNVHVVKKAELIRNTPLKRWKAIISSHGVRVDVLLKIIYRCFARNAIMTKEIDKTAKFLAQKLETKCYML